MPSEAIRICNAVEDAMHDPAVCALPRQYDFGDIPYPEAWQIDNEWPIWRKYVHTYCMNSLGLRTSRSLLHRSLMSEEKDDAGAARETLGRSCLL